MPHSILNTALCDAIYAFFGNAKLAKITTIAVLAWFGGIVFFPAVYDIFSFLGRGLLNYALALLSPLEIIMQEHLFVVKV